MGAGRGGTPAGLPAWGDTLAVAALHLGLVVVCSRVAGMRTSAIEALAISAAAYLVAAAALVWLDRRTGRPAHLAG